MNWFYDLKIGRKFALGFGLCLTLAVLVGIVALSRMAQMNRNATLLDTDTIAGASAITDITAHARLFRTLEYQYLLATDNATLDQDEADMREEQALTEASLDAYGKAITPPENRQDFDVLKADWQGYLRLHARFMPIGRRKDYKVGQAILNGPMYAQFSSFSGKLDEMDSWNDARGTKLTEEAKTTYASARALIIGLLILAVGMGTLVGVTITRYMTKTLAQISERMGMLGRHLLHQPDPRCGGAGAGRPDGGDQDGDAAAASRRQGRVRGCGPDVQHNPGAGEDHHLLLPRLPGEPEYARQPDADVGEPGQPGGQRPGGHFPAVRGGHRGDRRLHAGSGPGVRTVRQRGRRDRPRQQQPGGLHR